MGLLSGKTAIVTGAAKRLWKRMGKKKENRLFSALIEDDLKESRE
jgi:hypothetical protein